MEAVFGGIAFVMLFAGWVVVPAIIKKRHTLKVHKEESSES